MQKKLAGPMIDFYQRKGIYMEKNKEFLHCLRQQIYPDEYAIERIESAKSFCLKYGFKNVILLFNAEEFNVGHIKDEELVPWIEIIKQAKKVFNEVGISVSLNPWMELGHLDRGRKLQPGQDFQTMVDRFGKQSELVACPFDTNWKKYYLNQLNYYVKEVEPEVVWIEDDFRLHNHDPLDWGGCFCPLHMDAFNKKLNKNETREEFVNAISKRTPTQERKVWLDTSWEVMDNLAKDIANVVKKANVKTHVGLMSSPPFSHAMEARDWAKLHADLCYDGVKIDRIHLPAYREYGSKNYYFDFNRISMVNRSFLGDDCLIYPELENSSFSIFVKDKKFLSFQLESALPLGISGMTYNIFHQIGNGVQDEFGYGPAIKGLTPYLNTIKTLNVLPSQMEGLVFPLSEKTVYNSHKEGFLNLIPKDYDAVGYFSSFGCSYRISKERTFKDEVVILTSDNVYNFSSQELIDLFASNFVFVDGRAAFCLKQRNLLSLIKAKEVSFVGSAKSEASFEMYEKGAFHNMHHYRVTSHRRTGDFYSIDYEDGVNIISGVYGPRNERNSNGVAYSSNFFVYPYSIEGVDNTCFFMNLRTWFFEKYLLSHIKSPFVYTGVDGVYPYLYKQDKRFVLILTNANYYDFEKIQFELKNVTPNKIKLVDRKGHIKIVKFSMNKKMVTIKQPLKYLSTLTLIIE